MRVDLIAKALSLQVSATSDDGNVMTRECSLNCAQHGQAFFESIRAEPPLD